MRWRHDPLPLTGHHGKTFLPYGNGRSYGDSCLNDGGMLIDGRSLDRFIRFDTERGVIRCEAGVLLSEILKLIVPQGWFLPVTPGTQFVTLGGAIANDVHGKNHHRAGTLGCHVRCFELLRSDGTRRLCSLEENVDWFRATIGGLGLTGFITWAEIQLKSIGSGYLQTESIRCANLDEFFLVSAECDQEYEYTVAWVDCLARGRTLGRGLFLCGNHVDDMGTEGPKPAYKRRWRFSFPFQPPFSVVNRVSLRAFNWIYYHAQRRPRQRTTVHYEPFFYPLDAVGQWNWMYGRRGFMQYQCVIPKEGGESAVRAMLDRISVAGKGSFLAVLKAFGDRASPGLLSFPRAGITLALDFPNEGKTTLELLNGLDDVVRAADGRVYPGKDARMSPESFAAYYPHWRDLTRYRDARFSSSFWRRVTGEPR